MVGVLRPTSQVIDEFPEFLWVPRVSTALLFEVCIPQGFGQFSCSLSGCRELLTEHTIARILFKLAVCGQSNVLKTA